MNSKKLNVLVVDDSHDMLDLLRRNLNEMNINPYASDSVVSAIEIIENSELDLVITDLKMPGIGGVQLVRYIAQHYPQLPVLVISGYPNVETAVEVMKLGALEYLVKPFTYEELENAIQLVLSQSETQSSHEDIQKDEVVKEPIDSFHGIIGRSDAMQSLFASIERTKNNRATVLINGESGTGKEMVARAIHYNSRFSSAPFVPVNCGAIPDGLMESELFGHLKGAFTGATTNRVGFFQAADQGTLFLDEISNTSLMVQAKLLRAIQEKEVVMLGDVKSQKVEVRIISATNTDLSEQIEKGNFREDLYYRLNIVTINIPPLRERKEDIPLLVRFFNQKYSRENEKEPLKISAKVMDALNNYNWPGNVRELENFVHRLVIMNDRKVDIEQIPSYMKMNQPKDLEKGELLSLAEMEKAYIQRVLLQTNNNKTQAAKILGIDRKTLREKLK
ncbi:MAG: sigma-54-dependent Fis family transcriptional regulator [Flavobacteriales bacterium]|nr:sigma-54-dependent Fis family transcriptional regulator [Flavobacteriales bacterium]|tara:strand:+ start:49886 stop:51229 length:1344 start_codon:yes stop_codon:yes gene_type:complete